MSCLKACDIETNRRSVAYRLQRHISRRLVADQSATSQRVVGDLLATYATSSQSNLVAASLLCMFKGQLATDFNGLLVGDSKKTVPQPLQPLCDVNFFLGGPHGHFGKVAKFQRS